MVKKVLWQKLCQGFPGWDLFLPKENEKRITQSPLFSGRVQGQLERTGFRVTRSTVPMRTERAHSYTWPPSSPHQAEARPSRRRKTKEFRREAQRLLGTFWPKSHFWAQRGSWAFSLCLLRTWQTRAILYRGESFLPSQTDLCLASFFPQLTTTGEVISHCAALPLAFFRPMGWSAWFPDHLPRWHLCLASPCPHHPTSSLGIHDPILVATESVPPTPQEALSIWDGGHQQLHPFRNWCRLGRAPEKQTAALWLFGSPTLTFVLVKGWEGEFEPVAICILKHLNSLSTCLARCVSPVSLSAPPLLK